ncbi:MAG TPA: isochorismatase family cysteine hydrolase [Polyangiaceae bacterium]
MTDALTIDPKHAALLVMDYQSMIVDMTGDQKDALLANAKALIAAARKASVPVIYVVVGFRPGFPEVSARNLTFSAAAKSGRFQPGSKAMDIHEAVAPQGEEVVVTKHRVGAFPSTDLDMVLRAKEVTTLILAGIATSGVVLSTLRQAADLDFRIVVAKDACADTDPEVHRVLMDKVFARQATVTSSADVITALG